MNAIIRKSFQCKNWPCLFVCKTVYQYIIGYIQLFRMITRIIVIITIHYFDTTFLYLSTFIIVANKRNFSLNRYIVLCDTSGQRNYIVQIYRFENSASSSSFEAENLNRKSNQKPLDTTLNHHFQKTYIKSMPRSRHWYKLPALTFFLHTMQKNYFRFLLEFQRNHLILATNTLILFISALCISVNCNVG